MPKCGTIVSHACKKLKLFEPKHGKITKNTQWWLPLTSIDEKFQSPNLKNKRKNTKNPNPYDIQWSMSQPTTKKKIFIFKMI